MANFALSASSKRNLHGVTPKLIEVIELALTITGIDFGIPKDGGLRTAAQQNELFKARKSQLDGYSKKSNHQTGNAFDVFAYVNGKASWDESHLTHVATAILSAASQLGVPIKWGGHWRNFKDMPHFELAE